MFLNYVQNEEIIKAEVRHLFSYLALTFSVIFLLFSVFDE